MIMHFTSFIIAINIIIVVVVVVLVRLYYTRKSNYVCVGGAAVFLLIVEIAYDFARTPARAEINFYDRRRRGFAFKKWLTKQHAFPASVQFEL